MVNVQYVLGNRHDLCEMLDIFLTKSVQYKYTTMYSTDVITIYRSYIVLLTYSGTLWWEKSSSDLTSEFVRLDCSVYTVHAHVEHF